MKFVNLNNAKAVALVGIMAATIECGKLALSFLPNVEVVTLLCALYGYAFGWLGVVATFVFVCIEPLIYGFGSWVITYFIYWPIVAFVFMLFRKNKLNNRWIFTVVAVGMTVLFGLLSSLIDTVIYLGVNEYFFSNFGLYYLRGVVFCAIQIACNAALFPTAFVYLSGRLLKIKSLISLERGEEV